MCCMYTFIEKKEGRELAIDPIYEQAYETILNDNTLDGSIKAMMLKLPSENIIRQDHNPIDHKMIFEMREWLKVSLGKKFKND